MKLPFTAIALLALPLLAQDRAAINGSVTDASHAAIRGAAVELKSPATGFHRTVTTNETGVYIIAALAVGTYDLTINMPGFATSMIERIELQYAETRTIGT